MPRLRSGQGSKTKPSGKTAFSSFPPPEPGMVRAAICNTVMPLATGDKWSKDPRNGPREAVTGGRVCMLTCSRVDDVATLYVSGMHFQRKPYTAVFYILANLEFALVRTIKQWCTCLPARCSCLLARCWRGSHAACCILHIAVHRAPCTVHRCTVRSSMSPS